MQRIARRARLNPGTEAEYERMHAAIWPAVSAAIHAAGICNYSIYRDGLELFSYFETEDLDAAGAFLASQPVCDRWQQAMAPFMAAPDPLAPWRLLPIIWQLEP